MKVIVIYESLTGRTALTARLIAGNLVSKGVEVAVNNVTAIDMQALSDADAVVVGTWVDGFVIAGQRPGRSGRLASMPTLAGKQALVYCTYALDPGKVLDKLTRIVEGRGASVLGGLAIRRDRLEAGAADLARGLLEALTTP